MGSSTREDEPWAYEAREYLRTRVVGKPVTFTVAHSLSSNDDTPRDIGSVEMQGVDIATQLIKAGWAKLKEMKREPTEADLKKREFETEAKTAGKGIWNPHGPMAHKVHYMMPEDSQGFITEWKGKSIDAVVEQVKDGSTLRVRLLLPDGDHQFANITLAGVRSPRVASKPDETSEPYGEEAKFFTETRLLQRQVTVQLLSLPNATATPFQSAASSAPAPASIFIGTVLHAQGGNIAEHLVANGLARVVDWHAGMLAAGGGMERLRQAERAAKEKRLKLYANAPVPAAKSNGTVAANGSSRTFDGIVTRVWSGDQISVAERESGKERRVQLSSTRAPRQTEARQAHYANEAREFLRKKLIGKHVKVHVDFIRPREGDFEERECATVRYGNQNANIAEQIIEKGFATALRHRRDDEDRSPEYDKLMAAEQAAAAEGRGVHSGKEFPQPKQPLNISETHSRAAPFINGFKRQGRIAGVVDYVASGSRFKIFIPKDNQVLTLVLGGIRAPRTGRSPSDKSEPYGQEAYDFSNRRYMQRDVEFEIHDVDKSGGFIGALYYNKNENVAVSLVREGLASVHSYSADGLSWSKQLYDAEEEAKKAKRNMWSDYDEEAEQAVQVPEEQDSGALKPEYQDVIISDVRVGPQGLNFSVQILNTEGIASLEKLMREFSLHHKTVAPTAGFVPKSGDLVSAKFSDGQWYRAKVRRASPVKKEAELTFIDYGNQSTVAFADIRPLDARFRALPGQAHDARLAFVRLVGPESEYHAEALERFRALCEGRKLVANTDFREGPLRHLRLMDLEEHGADPLASVNVDLLREGLATLDRKGCRYLHAYPQVVKRMQEAVNGAKRDRLGIFELGDVEEDD
ncbi:nuclease domain-containing protein [Phanerochaete sordida]|uniref:Nuclease domain-containing protein n=1 Tax=Phanerochaete sordida TaxID=48140 RepID=A0A9P3GJ44_9APHY|nr:nuclease domain-containing protein [Phanerochaete sordida]